MIDVQLVKKRLENLLAHIELSIGQKAVFEVKRASWRYAWTSPATVARAEPGESFERLYVTTSTISAEGLNFRSSRIFERGQKVLISLQTDEGELQIAATVVHSTDWFGCKDKLGVKFDLEGNQHSSGSLL